MCRMASFLHNPSTGEVKVKVLDSHGETEKQLKLDPKIWREGHYTPEGEVELRLTNDDRVDPIEYKTAFMNRFPTFVSFFNWAMNKEGIYVNNLDLSSLTKLPDNIVLPKEISGSLYLNSLTKLPDNIKLPEKCGSLYLSSLTKLPDNIVLPKEISGSLDLSSLTKLPDNIVLPKEISGSLYLNSLTKLPDNIKLPEKCGSLYLSNELKEEWNKRMKKGK